MQDIQYRGAEVPEAQKQEEETIVVFRVWRGDPRTVIALMPELAATYAGVLCDSYEHVGQHGAADYHGVVARTRPATPEEYASLKAELESEPYGYRFKVRQRATWDMHEKRKHEALRLRSA